MSKRSLSWRAWWIALRTCNRRSPSPCARRRNSASAGRWERTNPAFPARAGFLLNEERNVSPLAPGLACQLRPKTPGFGNTVLISREWRKCDQAGTFAGRPRPRAIAVDRSWRRPFWGGAALLSCPVDTLPALLVRSESPRSDIACARPSGPPRTCLNHGPESG
jgi:hypothetical protein